MKVTFDNCCFGCGMDNPSGFKLRFEPHGKECWAELAVSKHFQSWQGIVHGGIVSLLLDEAMGWAARFADCPGVTGKLEVRLRQPLKVEEPVRVRGWVNSVRGRVVSAAACLERPSDGSKVAEAVANLVKVPVVESISPA